MADDGATDEGPVTFHVKASNDAKYTVTVPLAHTVLQLKEKLATSEYADLPADRQRLIYSGRVLKDPDTLATYKIKEGNTVHLVKGAASNQRAGGNAGTASTGSGQGATPAVPTNLSSGPGANNALAGLTGARYAGLAHLPNQSMFGPDGGMGPPPDPEQIIQLLENPQFASTLNEALSNPQIVETMIQQNPMLRDMGPEMRQMMQSPEFRRIMTDPQMLRSTMQMQRAFGGNPFGGARGAGGASAFPAPGATDTTPSGAQASDGQSSSPGQQGQPGQQQPPMNPFAMFGGAGGGAGAGGAAGGNPFAQMFNQGAAGSPQGGSGNATDPAQGGQAGAGQQQPFQNPFFNPQLMAQMMGNMNNAGANRGAAAATSPPPSGGPTDPSANPSAVEHPGQGPGQQQPGINPFTAALLGMMGGQGGAGGDPAGGAGAGAGAGGFNPFAAAFNPYGGYGGGGGGGETPAAPPDTRSPEDRYAEQLRQLNDMGFYEFERNVEALRRSGGSVQGAVEYLLSHPAA